MAHPHSSQSRRVLTFPDLKLRKGIRFSRQHIDRLVRAKKFPPPFKTQGGITNHWFDDVIDDYLVACAEGRDWSAD